VLDSDQGNTKRMPCWFPREGNQVSMPAMLARRFALEAIDSAGQWQPVFQREDNCERLVKVPLEVETTALRFVPGCAWGGERVHLMAFDVQ
jgi:hypothetical protein